MACSAFACPLGQPSSSLAPLAAPVSLPVLQRHARSSATVGPSVSGATLALLGSGFAAAVAAGLRRRKTTRSLRRAVGIVPSVDGLYIKPEDCEDLIKESRPAHWVIRTSDLKANLRFFSKVFGMKVLRHEEFDGPCAISCNGTYDTPWSKTMVGFEREDSAYCLELTYNYGVPEYEAGNGLAHIAVGVDDLAVTLQTAADMGYTVDGDMITGPDGYVFRAVAQQTDREERFQYVALRTSDAAKAAGFYEKALGMKELSGDFAQGLAAAQTRVVGYSDAQVPLLLLEDEAVQDIRLGQWEGRNAVAIPGRALRAVYQRVIEEGHGGGMLHPIREFNEHPMLRRKRGLPPMPCEPSPEEQLRALRENPDSAPPSGTLTVAVVTDADGYEICLVSSETYNFAVSRAYDPDGKIDWHWRGEAMAGRRTPTPDHMVACV